MLHNHLRNFTSHEFSVHFHAADKPDYRADGVNQFSTRIKVTGDHRSSFRDTCDTVSLCESGSGGGNHECRRDDELLSDVLVHKLFFFVPSKGWIVLFRAVDT